MTLPDDLNRPTRLSELWQRPPIVLVFVRHSGCTLCLDHAVVMREAYPEIQAAGAEVVLVRWAVRGGCPPFKEPGS